MPDSTFIMTKKNYLWTESWWFLVFSEIKLHLFARRFIYFVSKSVLFILVILNPDICCKYGTMVSAKMRRHWIIFLFCEAFWFEIQGHFFVKWQYISFSCHHCYEHWSLIGCCQKCNGPLFFWRRSVYMTNFGVHSSQNLVLSEL